MAITKKEIRDDVILRLTQALPTDDFEIPNSQIDHWIDIARDKVVSNYLTATTRINLHSVDPAYIHTVTGLAPSGLTFDINSPTNPPVLSIPLKDDKGLLRVQLNNLGTLTRVSKVDMFNLENIRTMEMTAPSTTNVVCYRREDIITTEGITDLTGYTLEIDYVPAVTGSSLDYSVSEIHIEDITTMATENGLKELGIFPDTINDDNPTSDRK